MSITNRDAALLGFKLLSLWLMANAAILVAAIPYYWEPHLEGLRPFTVFATLLPALVSVAVGVPVWFSAEWFADRIFPSASRPPGPPDRLRGEPIFALALSVLGILLVCEALPMLINGLALYTQSQSIGRGILGPDAEQQRLVWDATAKANLIGNAARLLIGAALMAGPARLAAATTRARKELLGDLAEEAAKEQRKQEAVEQPDAADEARPSTEPRS